MRAPSIAAIAAAALLSAGASTASAQTNACTLDLKDAAFDQTTTLNPSSASPVLAQPANTLDLRNLTLRHTAGTTTAVLKITNLSRKIPAGSTSTVWTVQWTAQNGTVYFVRAVNDLANNLVFEWGEQVPPVTLGGISALPRYEYRGATPGQFVAGENGTIELTIPAALSAPGTRFSDIYAQSSEGRQVVPNAAATPTRGLSSPSDRLPDGSDFAGPWNVASCDPAPAASSSSARASRARKARAGRRSARR